MYKSYGFDAQATIGAMGVALAKKLLRTEYGGEIRDLDKNRTAQQRGMDLWVEGLGFVEVKTDSHKAVNIFVEVSMEGKPGALDRSAADYFGVLFFKEGVFYLFPRPALNMWMRENWAFISQERPDWIKEIRSHRKNSTWEVMGVIVPIDLLEQDIQDIIILSWEVNGEDEWENWEV